MGAERIAENITIVIPARNEASSLEQLLPEIKKVIPNIGDIIVVNDGSKDHTSEVCKTFSVRELKHPVALGNGASVKDGVRAVKTPYALMMDADGQHPAEVIPELLARFQAGFGLVIGARQNDTHANLWRRFANWVYNHFASYITNHKILDLTSGFRLFDVNMFKDFMHLYPNGFSYPTTSTMAFLKSGYSVSFVPFAAIDREDKSASHINIFKDGIKFLLIIFKIGTLYSPLKIFFPVALIQMLLGFANYAYTYIEFGRFTNMSALLMTSSALIFLIGLISEQITMLLYKK